MAEIMQLMENWNGFVPSSDVNVNESALAQLIDLIDNKSRWPAHRHEYLMKEVITTTDFPYLFGIAIDRQMLAMYRTTQADWRSWFKVSTVPNFNTHTREKVQGNDTVLPRVMEKGEYHVAPMSDYRYSIAVGKYGRQFDISWEAIINDSMGAFATIPERFARAALNTESWLATSTYASAAGPNVGLFGTPITDIDGQLVTNQGVLPLTIANLETTCQLMAVQTDVNGTPIMVRGVHLVVPPQLEFTARQILTSAQMQWLDTAAGAIIPVPTSNVISQYGLQLHVDPWLPIIDATATDDSTWYLFADPAQGAAVEFAFLRGYESPEVCMKNSDKVSVGGGAPLSSFSGDFATDNILYRVRHVVGADQMDPRFCYAQVAP